MGVHAQKAQLVRSLTRPWARGGIARSLEVGNYHLTIPNIARKVAGTDLIHDYFLYSHIDAQHYPKLATQNDIQTFRAFQNFTEHAKQFQHEFPQIAAQVQTEVVNGQVDYSRLIPQDPGIIYLGEVHYVESVQREVVSFVRQLANTNPQKPIIVATEFLSYNPALSLPENLIASAEDYSSYFDKGNLAANVDVLTKMLSLPNVYLIGLENDEVLHRILKRSDGKLTVEEYGEFMQTNIGMNLRNHLWARTLTRLQKIAPEAQIVAYGGIAHFSLHEENAVPSLVPGKHFVIQLSTLEGLPYNNPLTASLSISEPSLHMFEKNPSSKIVAGWKSPFPDYRHLLGNDLSIIVHE